MYTYMVLAYFQKGCDTLDHEILVKIKKYFGFQISVVKWFESISL